MEKRKLQPLDTIRHVHGRKHPKQHLDYNLSPTFGAFEISHQPVLKMEQGKKHQKHLTLVFLFFFFLFLHSFTNRSAAEVSKSKHFVLVHGACHGAWSWYKVASLLQTSGHKVTALDLGASGVNQQQAMDFKSISDYFKPLIEFMASLGDDERVVLVGHSFGGLAIAQAMEHFPHKIAVAVFVTAVMPPQLPIVNASATISQQDPLKPVIDNNYTYDDDPNNLPNTIAFGPRYLAPYLYQLNQDQDMDNQYTYDDGLNNFPTTIQFGPRYLRTFMYHLSPHEDLVLATTLMRPFRLLYNRLDLIKMFALSHTRYGSVSRVFVKSLEDRADNILLQEMMIAFNRPDRVYEISGSDHMVMMSKPKDLFLHLQTIAADYD